MGSSVPLFFALGWVAKEKRGADSIDWATFATWRSNNHDGPFEELLDRETRMAAEERKRFDLGHAKTRGRPSRDSRVDARKQNRQTLNVELLDSSSTLNAENSSSAKDDLQGFEISTPKKINKKTITTLKRGKTDDADAVPRRNPPRRCTTLTNTTPNEMEYHATGEDVHKVANNIATVVAPSIETQFTNVNRAVDRTEKSWGGLFNPSGSPNHNKDDAELDDDQPDDPENIEDKSAGETPASKPERFLDANYPKVPKTQKSWGGLFYPSGSPDHHPDDACMFFSTNSDDDQPDDAQNVEEKKIGEAPLLQPEIFMGALPNLPKTEKSWAGLFNPMGSPNHHQDDADSDYDPPSDAEYIEHKEQREATIFKSKMLLNATPTLPRTEKSWAGLFNAEGTPEREHNDTETEDDEKGSDNDEGIDYNRKEYNKSNDSPRGAQDMEVEHKNGDKDVGDYDEKNIAKETGQELQTPISRDNMATKHHNEAPTEGDAGGHTKREGGMDLDVNCNIFGHTLAIQVDDKDNCTIKHGWSDDSVGSETDFMEEDMYEPRSSTFVRRELCLTAEDKTEKQGEDAGNEEDNIINKNARSVTNAEHDAVDIRNMGSLRHSPNLSPYDSWIIGNVLPRRGNGAGTSQTLGECPPKWSGTPFEMPTSPDVQPGQPLPTAAKMTMESDSEEEGTTALDEAYLFWKVEMMGDAAGAGRVG